MSSNGQGDGRGVPKSGNDSAGRPLPKRFYKLAAAAQTADGRWRLELDGRPARSPAKRELAVAQEPLARAIADEWQAQGGTIDPASMPLTRLVNSAIDGVSGRETEVAADIASYATSDLLCYRAARPDGLVAKQAAAWDPVLQWARDRHGLDLRLQTGVMPVAQPANVAERVLAALGETDAFRLAAMHVMTTLMGSAVLSLAVADGCLSPDAAWAVAHVDEDWQVSEWGEDAEARARRNGRWRDMAAAARLLDLLDR